jgi:hypothetical protein
MRPSWTCLDDEFFSLIGDGNLEASWGKEDDQPPNESDGSTIKMVRLLHGMAEWPIRAHLYASIGWYVYCPDMSNLKSLAFLDRRVGLELHACPCSSLISGHRPCPVAW